MIAAICRSDPPPMSSLQPMTPPALDRVVKKCLPRIPKRAGKAQATTDELKWIAEGGSQAGMPAPVATRGKSWLSNSAWSVAALLPVCGASSGLRVFCSRAEPHGRSRLFISPPERCSCGLTIPGYRRLRWRFRPTDIGSPLWPDRGRQISPLGPLARHAHRAGAAGTEGASSPFWSPDSRFLGFFAGGKLKKIEVSGGPPITLCDATGQCWRHMGSRWRDRL